MTTMLIAQEATDTEVSIRLSPDVSGSSSVQLYPFVQGDAAEVAISVRRGDDRLCREFHALADWWREATQFLSSPTEIADHEAYQRIIDIGPRVVPFILEELRDNGGDWYIALRRLVADPPTINQETARSTTKVVDTWLEWGRQRGYRL